MMFLLFILGTMLFILATYGVLRLLTHITGHRLLEYDDQPIYHARLYNGARCTQCGGDHYDDAE